MDKVTRALDLLVDRPLLLVLANLAVVLLVVLYLFRKQASFVLKSLARNPIRTGLTSLATMVLVFIVTLVWTIVWFLNLVTEEKAKDLKAIVTERWQIPSQMPFAYASSLAEGAASKPTDVHPQDYMTWQFFGATLEPGAKRTRENLVFFFAMQPEKLLTMMDGMEEFTPQQLSDLGEAVRLMQADKRRIIVGRERLKAMNKKVPRKGEPTERISLYSINYKDIVLDECEIIAAFPEGRYDQSAVMSCDRVNNALDVYKRKNGKPHPMAEKTLNLVWLKVPDTQAFNQVAEQVMNSSLYSSPAVKCETASSGIASFLDAYRDLLWGMRWVLVPVLLASMALVIAVAISISVRERRMEMAVLKVLGFEPARILAIVLGEAITIGVGSGLVSAVATYAVINWVVGGIKFPIAFFPAFFIPPDALWWGPAIGGITALLGSFFPAWNASTVRVAEVFSKTT